MSSSISPCFGLGRHDRDAGADFAGLNMRGETCSSTLVCCQLRIDCQRLLSTLRVARQEPVQCTRKCVCSPGLFWGRLIRFPKIIRTHVTSSTDADGLLRRGKLRAVNPCRIWRACSAQGKWPTNKKLVRSGRIKTGGTGASCAYVPIPA
jgi:hypothetical protein